MANIQLNQQQQATYDTAIKKYGYTSPASVPPIQQPPQNQNIGSQLGAVNQTPAYDTTSGLLTDYGRSQNLPEVNAPQNNNSTSPGTTNTGGITTQNAPQSTNPYLNQVQALSQLSPAEVDAQTQLNILQSNATQGQFNVSQQPIAQGFISGQQSAMQTQANIAQQPLQLKLALAQAQRQAALDAAKTGLSATMPTNLPYGASLVNPITGATVNGGIFGSGATGTSGAVGINPATGLQTGASTTDILGYLSKSGINPTRYDMPGLINAVQNGATAQDIISGKVNVAAQTSAGTSGAAYKLNPLTGQYEQPNPSKSNPISTPALLGGFANVQAVKAFQTAHGLVADGIVGPKTRAAMSATGMTVPPNSSSNSSSGGSSAGSASGGQTSSNTPATLPTPTTYAQKAFATDFTSGGLSDKINAQNTAVGHLTAAYDLAQKMQNWSLQPGNAGKNWLATTEGKAAVDNYKLAHQFSSSEADAAYGIGSAGERDVTSALGSANSSPEQLKGFVQTSGALLSSKILSNIQQYKTAYGANAPINLDWFIAPQNRAQLSQIGIQIHQDGNSVGAYQQQADGSYKQI